MNNQTATSSPKVRLIDNAPLIVVCLLLIDSLHFVFARLLLPYLPPAASAFYVLAIATAQVAFFARLQGRLNFGVFRRNMGFFLVVGFLVAVSTILNYAAIEFIDPGTASLLSKAAILFGLGFSLVWLQDQLSRQQWGGVGVAIVGVVVITFQPGDYLRLGALMVLTSAFMYALHAALVKRYSEHLNLVDFFLFRLLSTSGFLLVLTAGGGQLVWPGPQAWLILLATATVDVVISRALYYLSLRQLKMSLHTIVLTASPVVAVGWSVFLFGVEPTAQQLIGGGAILAGIFLVTFRNKRAK